MTLLPMVPPFAPRTGLSATGQRPRTFFVYAENLGLRLIALLGLMALCLTGLLTPKLAFGETALRPAIYVTRDMSADPQIHQAISVGARKFMAETGRNGGVTVGVIEYVHNPKIDHLRNLDQIIAAGANIIVGIGFDLGIPFQLAAEAYPNVNFVIMNSHELRARNLRKYNFDMHHAGYVAGVGAAIISATGALGVYSSFVHGENKMLTCGFRGGAKSTSKSILVLEQTAGTSAQSWNALLEAQSLSQSLIKQDIDIALIVAGTKPVLAFREKLNEKGRLSVLIDYSGTAQMTDDILAIIAKRIDLAIYDSLHDAYRGKFRGGDFEVELGTPMLDVKFNQRQDQRLGYARMVEAVAATRQQIADGKLSIHNYKTSNFCPY